MDLYAVLDRDANPALLRDPCRYPFPVLQRRVVLASRRFFSFSNSSIRTQFNAQDMSRAAELEQSSPFDRPSTGHWGTAELPSPDLFGPGLESPGTGSKHLGPLTSSNIVATRANANFPFPNPEGIPSFSCCSAWRRKFMRPWGIDGSTWTDIRFESKICNQVVAIFM